MYYLKLNCNLHLILLFKAKSLEQMDEEFGVGNLIREESEKRQQKVKRNLLILFHYFICF